MKIMQFQTIYTIRSNTSYEKILLLKQPHASYKTSVISMWPNVKVHLN